MKNDNKDRKDAAASATKRVVMWLFDWFPAWIHFLLAPYWAIAMENIPAGWFCLTTGVFAIGVIKYYSE